MNEKNINTLDDLVGVKLIRSYNKMVKHKDYNIITIMPTEYFLPKEQNKNAFLYIVEVIGDNKDYNIQTHIESTKIQNENSFMKFIENLQKIYRIDWISVLNYTPISESLISFLQDYNLNVDEEFTFCYTDKSTNNVYEHKGLINRLGDLEILSVKWFDVINNTFIFVKPEDLPNDSYYIQQVFPEISSFSIFEIIDREDLIIY